MRAFIGGLGMRNIGVLVAAALICVGTECPAEADALTYVVTNTYDTLTTLSMVDVPQFDAAKYGNLNSVDFTWIPSFTDVQTVTNTGNSVLTSQFGATEWVEIIATIPGGWRASSDGNLYNAGVGSLVTLNPGASVVESIIGSIGQTWTQTGFSADLISFLGSGSFQVEEYIANYNTIASAFAISSDASPETTMTLEITYNYTPAVPESSTWAMLLIGFTGIGLMTYRRHQFPKPAGTVSA